MKKMKIGIALILCSAVFLSGCGNTIPELTEEQQDMVVEYAVGTLLKHNKQHKSRVIEISKLEELETKNAAIEAALAKGNEVSGNKEVTEEVPEDDAQVQEVKTEVIDNTQSAKPEYTSVEDFMQTEQLSFQYIGYEVVGEYPKHESGEEFFFVMSATQGNQLLVLKFLANNISGEEVNLDMNSQGLRFKVSVDGEEKNALTTMLLNDMAYYQGTISAGESKELVLVCEIPTEKSEGITKLELIVKNVDNTATISLN